MINRILITGGTGFIGKNLIEYLNNNSKYDLSLLVRKDSIVDKSISSKNILYFGNPINLSHFDAIIHLAGKAHDLKGTSLEQEYYDINFGLTNQLYDDFLKSSASVFIFLSSVKAQTSKAPNYAMEETYMGDPSGPYGLSKKKAEEHILKTFGENKLVYILRPVMVHGPGNKGNLNLLYKFVNSGIPYPLGSFKNNRSYLSVNNLCFVISQLLEKQIPQGVYNLADDDPLSTTEVIKLISEIARKKSKIISIPKFIIHFFSRIGDIIPFPLNSNQLNKLTENFVVSNQKIKSALSIKNKWDTAEGLKKTIRSFEK